MLDWDREELDHFISAKRTGLLFLYTPFCGTCQVSEKMLTVAAELLPDTAIGKININYMPVLAEKWVIESVPCLVFLEEGDMVNKLYAFQSVPYLVETIKSTFHK